MILAVPDGHYPEETMRITVVPNRNPIHGCGFLLRCREAGGGLMLRITRNCTFPLRISCGPCHCTINTRISGLALQTRK